MWISEKKNPEKVLVGSRNNYVNLFDLMYHMYLVQCSTWSENRRSFSTDAQTSSNVTSCGSWFSSASIRKPVEYLSIGNPYFRKQLTIIYTLTLFHGLSTINIAMRIDMKGILLFLELLSQPHD